MSDICYRFRVEWAGAKSFRVKLNNSKTVRDKPMWQNGLVAFVLTWFVAVSAGS